MIFALLLGREGSEGFPGKNIYPLLGRPLMAYPMLAALNSKYVNEVFLSTDSKKMGEIATGYGAKVIDRPAELASSTALADDAFVHGYNYVKGKTNEEIEMIVLLLANAVMVLPETIDKGIEILRSNPEIDSAITVSGYNMWTPIRARRIGPDGLLHPFIPLENFKAQINSNRQTQDTVYFHDCGVSVVRPKCLEHIADGLLPQKWMGQKIAPLIQTGGLDIDYKYEVPQAENWLKEKGYTEDRLPYPLKK